MSESSKAATEETLIPDIDIMLSLLFSRSTTIFEPQPDGAL